MSELMALQFKFATLSVELFSHILEQGLLFRYGETWRSVEQAKWNAEHRVGIANSIHCDRLAVDLLIHDSDGKEVPPETYKEVADYWKSLDPDNAWGGDFKGTTSGDIYHYSLSYGGRK